MPLLRWPLLLQLPATPAPGGTGLGPGGSCSEAAGSWPAAGGPEAREGVVGVGGGTGFARCLLRWVRGASAAAPCVDAQGARGAWREQFLFCNSRLQLVAVSVRHRPARPSMSHVPTGSHSLPAQIEPGMSAAPGGGAAPCPLPTSFIPRPALPPPKTDFHSSHRHELHKEGAQRLEVGRLLRYAVAQLMAQ